MYFSILHLDFICTNYNVRPDFDLNFSKLHRIHFSLFQFKYIPKKDELI
jgi:hypothetical protein